MSDQDDVARRVVDAMRAAGQAAEEAVSAAYERGLRRGLAIAREHEGEVGGYCEGDALEVDWSAAHAQVEREIEEAKR